MRKHHYAKAPRGTPKLALLEEHCEKMRRKKERVLLPHRRVKPIANLSRKHKYHGRHPSEAYGG